MTTGVQMQYLDSIIIHNFKSFKHANIKFSRGFNCIVGPNGSGKSNICDSLLFALGESSLKRMRVPNTSQLINSFAKPKKEDGVKKAYVKINFGGPSPIEVARIIKSNNKIGYRLNSNKVTRQELIDVLRSYRSEINDTNIIAQGEISYMVNLNSKERRELIDVAAGIKEFNDKKETAMKELGKVEEKINSAHIVLNERKGFLEQLAKEKEDAEEYLKLTEMVKRISYTLLKNSEKQSETDFESTIQKVKANDERKKELTAIITEIDLMLEKFSKDKETLSKTFNERSVELSGTNKLMENINKDLAVKESQSKSLKEKISETETQISQSSRESKKLKEESADALKNIGITQKELDDKAKQLTSKETYEQESSPDTQISRIGRNQKGIDELYIQEEALSKKYLQSKFEIESLEKAIKTANVEKATKIESYGAVSSSMERQKEQLADLGPKLSKGLKEIETHATILQTKKKELDGTYAEILGIREQLAILGGGSDKLNSLLKRNIEKGFYGRAYELCTCEEKYEFAINAVAMNRLNYFVVESAEIADQAIKLIKTSQAGRASFIPLKDMATKYREENEKLDKLIDHIKFDKRFEKAFVYLFANTYVVDSIDQAKKIGFGKGRFVTLEGEIIEQSGIITGGSKKQLQSLPLLELKLKSANSEQSKINDEIASINLDLDMKKKEVATYQTEILNCNIELKHFEKDEEKLREELETIAKKSDELSSKLLQLNKSSAETDGKRNQLLEELTKLKTENESIISTNEQDASKSKSKMSKAEMGKLRALRSEVEAFKIKIATLSKEQELKDVRLAEIENELKTRKEEHKETIKKLAILDNELMVLNASKKELQEKMGKSDAHSQELFKKLQHHDSEISKLASRKGKEQSDLEKTNRDLIEQETRKVQIQTRINDIKAELLSYENIKPFDELTAEEMNAKRTIAKNEIEKLGAVNLKAPEVYETRKKDVDDAKDQLNILDMEKSSIVSMINEIESKKLSIFTETLNDVNQSFTKLYSYVLEGSAHLQLENPKDPFNSGLSIAINSTKNRNGNIDALSGGEKILVMLMLIFAIQTHDPMAFYIFDEIDISLDKENSKKLSKLMKEISKKSQVIVISHNDSLITAADTAIGVVNRNHESRVVGLQLTPTEIKAN